MKRYIIQLGVPMQMQTDPAIHSCWCAEVSTRIFAQTKATD